MDEICYETISSANESMDLLTGKWKFSIIGYLLFKEKMRFSDLQNELKGIGPKMLTKELQDLELNHIVKRSVNDQKPTITEYELTDYGKKLRTVIIEISKWGTEYREKLHGSKRIAEI